MESNPIITVTVFWNTGKFYSQKRSILKDEHYYKCKTFERDNLDSKSGLSKKVASVRAIDALEHHIKTNNNKVLDYSPINDGFDGDFAYVVEVEYQNEEGFCFFTINNINKYH